MKLSSIADLIGGKMSGEDIEILGVANLENQASGTIAYAEKPKSLKLLSESKVSALIVKEGAEVRGKPFISVENPRLAFQKVLAAFSPYQDYEAKIYPNSFVADSAKLGKNVTVMPFACVMDGAEIGANSVLYPHVFVGKGVKIGSDCVLKSGVKIDDLSVLGDRVVIHHNSVVGGDGFGYEQVDGINFKTPQIGTIRIGDDVEIGACVAIDRSTMGETLIGSGVKIDNLVQIAHNVKIGENTILAGQTGIAGSCTLGKNCILAGQVGMADHIELGDHVVVMSKTGVEKRKVESGSVLMGIPARDVMLQRRVYASLDRLPEVVKIVRKLEKELGDED